MSEEMSKNVKVNNWRIDRLLKATGLALKRWNFGSFVSLSFTGGLVDDRILVGRVSLDLTCKMSIIEDVANYILFEAGFPFNFRASDELLTIYYDLEESTRVDFKGQG